MIHTDREYEQELQDLRDQLLLMGARVEQMIFRAMQAFRSGDKDLARGVIQEDVKVDQLEKDIDEHCILILAKRQPVASDLRFLTTALKIVTDLERIGDLAANIAERATEFSGDPVMSLRPSLEQMAEAAHGMVTDALKAFMERDALRAEAVMRRDTTVDEAYAHLFPELMNIMMNNPGSVYSAQRLQSVGKYLERIADHATNVAEDVIFYLEALDVRHSRPPSALRALAPPRSGT